MKDLLAAKGAITKNLIPDSENFRKTSVGVFDNEECLFMSTPHQSVPKLMKD